MKPTELLAAHAGHRAWIRSATEVECVECSRRIVGLPALVTVTARQLTSELRCEFHKVAMGAAGCGACRADTLARTDPAPPLLSADLRARNVRGLTEVRAALRNRPTARLGAENDHRRYDPDSQQEAV